MKKIRVGIIGFGFMGTTHYQIYHGNPQAKVVAMADVDPRKRQGDIRAVIGNIGGGDNSQPLDLSGIKTYADGMELIADPNVDLVDVCVPVFLHKQYALAALAAGKHVLCEKPLARTSADAAEIAAAARQAKGSFMVGMCIRFWPEYQHTYAVIQSGQAGKVRSATFKRLSPDIDGNGWQNWFMNSQLSGGAIFDLHLHDVDFIRYLLGMPRRVTAFGVKGVRSDKNGIDHVMARYDYGDGSLVTAEGGWDAGKGTPFEMSFQIVCEHLTFRLSETGYKIIHADGRVETPQLAPDAGPTGWHAEIAYLLECLAAGTRPNRYMTPAEDVVDAIRLVEAETKSIDTNATIQL